MTAPIPFAFRACLLAGLFCLSADRAAAQVTLKAEPVSDAEPKPDDPPKKAEKKDLVGSWQTMKEARTLILSVPAPRGQIVDRNGIPLAQNRVVQYLALNFPHFTPPSPEKILEFAHAKIALANRALGKTWALKDEDLLKHYENRRWVPLVFSVKEGLNEELTVEEQEKIKPLLGTGLFLQPAYVRRYPKDATACHIIGYAGRTRPLPITPVQDGDPLFEEMEGREGLELTFDRDLKGQPGSINYLFNPDGTRLKEEVLRRPAPGNNIVTTLDFNFQNYAEVALAKNARNGGAMVIMDVHSGDVLAMASNPGFNLNDFVPGINQARYKELSENPKLPLFARAFRGEYPPASTFKLVVSLAALESGKIDTGTYFDCDSAMQIGNVVMHNWAKEGEGPMNVITAIKRSCNTWFYKAGLEIGGEAIANMALRMGFGEKTGLPLKAEASGFVQTAAWTQQRLGHKFLPGDVANIAIGQGRMLASPIQVCQSMAAIADGLNMPQARIVKQVQDLNDRVVQAFPIRQKRVELQPDARDAAIKGMIAVVNASGGTGKNAAIKHAMLAGKTGTAQWKNFEDDSKDRRLAWFTGFVPATNPVYAFAIVYEGAPGEKVSGGAIAAPIVSEVFTKIYENASPEDPLVIAARDAPKAEIVEEDENAPDSAQGDGGDAAPPPPPPPPPEKKSFWKRLFGR